MKSTQRITISLQIDLEETQASDVEDHIRNSKHIREALGHLDRIGDWFCGDLHTSTGEASSWGVHVEHTTRYIP